MAPADLAASHDAALARIYAARDELAAMPPPASKTGLARRLGWEPWVIDLLLAGLMSLTGNLTACILIAIGAKGTPERQTIEALLASACAVVEQATGVASRPALAAPANEVVAIGCIDRHATQRLERKRTGQVRVRATLDDYARCCAEQRYEAATPTEAVAALSSPTGCAYLRASSLWHDANVGVSADGSSPLASAFRFSL